MVATKFFNAMDDDPNHRGGSRRWIMRGATTACVASAPTTSTCTRCTAPTRRTDIDETLGALDDLVHQGKVRSIGSSTFPAEAIVEAQWSAARRSTERFVCEQPPYSIFARRIEHAVLPTCERYGMGVIPWSPLNGGWLTGKYRRDAEIPARLATGAPREHQPLYETESPTTSASSISSRSS